MIRKHIKKVGAVSVDYSFARACASAIDTRRLTAATHSAFALSLNRPYLLSAESAAFRVTWFDNYKSDVVA